jgi:hypothetical protein
LATPVSDRRERFACELETVGPLQWLKVKVRREGRFLVSGVAVSRLLRQTSRFAARVPHREVIWLEPRIVAEVSYAELVQGRLRAPVFRIY